MTDRELLERAAKAAGWSFPPAPGPGSIVSKQWNPLTDDGDALRLAVKLGLRVCSGQADWTDDGYKVEFDEGPDPYAATRRAIVRAAAEIGRS